jgi:hypothetical protein
MSLPLKDGGRNRLRNIKPDSRIWPRKTFGGKPVWEGVVHVFDLAGHPTATRAYAWSSPIEESTKRRFFAALHTDRINSPLEAMQAAIVADHRGKTGR